MRKRILSTLLALCLALSLLPASALAAGGGEAGSPSEDSTSSATISVSGVELMGSEGTPAYATTDEDGAVITEGASEDNYNIMWDGATLTLQNAKITDKSMPEEELNDHFIIRSDGDLTIKLVGANTVTGPDDANGSIGISAGGSLTIDGEGSLDVSGGYDKTDSGSYGISTYSGNITINGGSITTSGGDSSGKNCGIHAESGSVTINSGTVTANGTPTSSDAGSYGIYAGTSVTVTGGSVTVTGGSSESGNDIYSRNSYGVYARTSVSVSGGIVKATGGTVNMENSSSYGICAGTSVSVTGGSVTATGGTVTVNGNSYGISGGTNISGGEVTAEGRTAAINGATVAAPVSGQQIAVTAGADADKATAIDDSPFTSETTITDLVSDAQYFHSVAGEIPPSITEVTVTPATATLQPGSTRQFTATVSGTGNYNHTVTWSVSGNHSTGTSITDDGLLTVGSDETADTTLTVTATATGDGAKIGTATVTVTAPDPDPDDSEANIWVGGVRLTGTAGTPAYATTNDSGAVTTDSADEDNYNIKWDGATLTLKGAIITAGHQFTYQTVWDYSISGSAAIYYEGGSDINIALEGDNTVTGPSTETGSETAGGSYGIFAWAPLPNSPDDLIDLTISGDGTLEVAGGAAYPGERSCGIYADQLVIDSGTVQAAGGPVQEKQIDENTSGVGESYGIYTLGGVTINDGTVTAAGGKRETGTSTSSYGIQAYGPITINGGTVTARGSTLALDIYSGDGFFVQVNPPENKAIAVTSSNSIDGNNAEAIDGSPFNNDTNITEYIKDYTRYIHSEVRDLSSPDPNPPTNHEIYVGGVGLTGTAGMPAYATTNDSGTVTTQDASADNYNIKWDGETLTLNNAAITQGALGGAAIWYYRDSDLNIDLVGTNTVTGPSGSGSGASYGIFAYGPTELIGLTISGDGSLTVTGGGTVSGSFGICTGNLIVQSGSVNATGGDGAEDSYGIYANKNLTISGGTVNATGGDSGEDSYGISAYDVTISRGDVTATGGTVTATSEDGAEDSYGIYADYVTIYGGAVNATGRDSAEDSYGIYVDYVTINGGTVTAEGGTAEVKSAGIDIVTLVISGGTVTATGNTSGVYAVYDGKRITIDPQTDQQIEVLLGESETAAAAIEGSPFASETEITGLVNNTGKYFHSEVVGTTPPEPEEFTITFDAAGGTTPASQTTVDGKLTSLPTSTRDGYDFLGWYTAGGDWVTTDTVFTADTTLYARWAEQAGPGDDDKPPYIPPQPTGPNTGNSEGWDDIQEEIGQAQPGDTITIDMNGETEVPAEIFEEVAGKDVTVELDLGGGITWTVNGQDVPTDTSLSDLDLGVDLGTNGISADVINTVTGAYGTVQMTLAHDGAFGFTLTLTAPLGRENAGYWANLYHYDEEAEALTFETSAQIADDGSVALRMSHASQYAIVIDDKNHGENAGQPTLNTQDHDAYLLGYEDGTVRPEGSITRAEVATIFFRLLTDESRDKFWSQTNDYTDVPADAWYNSAVSTLSNAGILDGYEDGTFRPDGNITRAEFATITARFLEASYDGGNRFPDIDGHWAAEYINEAANAGIVDGYEDGTFRPQQNITRAEAVTMVNRTVDRHPDADHLLDNMVTWPDNPESAWYYAQIQEATNAHAYTMHTDQEDAPYEIWTELLPNRDWSALEQAWSDAHAGGEHATA